MTDWTLPTTAQTYANYTAQFANRDLSLALWMDSALVSDTNVPANSVRWNSANKNWERWSGTVWAALAATYGISITGNAATATNATTASNATSLGGIAAAGYALVAGSGTQVFAVASAAAAGQAVNLGQADARYAAIAQVHFVGTTAIAANRASAAQTLTGISIDGNAATATTAGSATTATSANAAVNAMDGSQAWVTTFTPARALGTPYQNATAKPIEVAVTQMESVTVQLIVRCAVTSAGLAAGLIARSSNGTSAGIIFNVPAGWFYQVDSSVVTPTSLIWSEFR